MIKQAMDELNRALMEPSVHPLRENMSTGWTDSGIRGETERPLHGEDLPNEEMITSAIHEHTAPKVLPPRPELRSHLSDEAKAAINKAKGKASKFLQPKLAWSGAVKSEVLKRWGKSPNLPAEDQLPAFLDHIEKLVPAGPKQKAYTLYLCGQHLGVNPPAWVPGEDDAVIRPLMFDFDKLVTKGKISGAAADIASYRALGRLKAVVQQARDEAEEGPKDRPVATDEAEAALDRFAVNRTKYLPRDLRDIREGSTIVAEADGWAVYKIKQNPSPAGKVAAQLLCNNGINEVSWCVGRGTLSYLGQGPFYVLVKGGVSRFAISSEMAYETATIWNPSDTPVWVTTTGDDQGMSNLMATAQKLGAPLDMSQISSLPAAVIPILKAATAADSQLATLIPATHLVEGDTTVLDKVIMACPLNGLVADLADAFSSERTVGVSAAVMGRCIALHYDFAPEYSMFNEALLVGYIELLAAAGQGLPKSLEDAIIQAIESTPA